MTEDVLISAIRRHVLRLISDPNQPDLEAAWIKAQAWSTIRKMLEDGQL